MSAREPETHVYQSAGLIDILAAVVRKAIVDYKADYHGFRMPEAFDFLVSAGLVDPETGLLDWHNHVPPPPRAPRRTARPQGRENSG